MEKSAHPMHQTMGMTVYARAGRKRQFHCSSYNIGDRLTLMLFDSDQLSDRRL
jgi:hypothetical protein